MVKHLIPSKTNKPPSPSKHEPHHYSYPFQSDRSLKQFDSDLFPANPSPFVPSIAPSFASHSHSFSRHDSKGNPKNNPFYDNSLFLKVDVYVQSPETVRTSIPLKVQSTQVSNSKA